MKNLCAKTVKPENAYEVWQSGTWTWYVLKKWQADDNKPFARWFCLVKTPFVPEGELGDVYVKEVRGSGARRVSL
jgi:hypothetical protein